MAISPWKLGVLLAIIPAAALSAAPQKTIELKRTPIPEKIAAPEKNAELEKTPIPEKPIPEKPISEKMAAPEKEPAKEPEKDNYTAIANSHCTAFLQATKDAHWEFVLGKAGRLFSPAERDEFNRKFSRKLIREYALDTAKPCALDVVSRRQADLSSNAPVVKGKAHRAAVLPEREIAVVEGSLIGTGDNADTPIAYRFEQQGQSGWLLANITVNGVPMIDRYREKCEQLAEKYGARYLLDKL